MRLATLRLNSGTAAVRIDDESTATVIDGFMDLSDLLCDPDWESIARDAAGGTVEFDRRDLAAVVPRPGKIVCVGLNYASHIKEMGRELPQYPTLFAKFSEALTGPYDDVVVPAYAASAMDWEAELAFVIGKPAYQVAEADAADYIAGYSVINDYTMRDYQYRTAPVGPGQVVRKDLRLRSVPRDGLPGRTTIETRLDGEVMQHANTSDLVFTPAKLVDYISHIVTLRPGDVVITGTTGGVGHARKPPRYITDGQTVEISIEGLGTIATTTIVK